MGVGWGGIGGIVDWAGPAVMVCLFLQKEKLKMAQIKIQSPE